MSITLNLTLQLILGERCEFTRTKTEMGIYDYSGNIHLLMESEVKMCLIQAALFTSLQVVQGLNTENQQTRHITIENLAFHKILIIWNIVER